MTPSASPTTTTPSATPEPTETTPAVTKDASYSSAEDLYDAAVMAGHGRQHLDARRRIVKANSMTSGPTAGATDENVYFFVYDDEATAEVRPRRDPRRATLTKSIPSWPERTGCIVGATETLDLLQPKLGGEHPTWADKKPKPKPKPKPAAHRVTERQWAKVVKNPDKYKGKRYIIYGEVNQFDSATGDSNFLADTANHDTTSYGYFDGENSWMEGKASKLEDLVEDDVFKATVTVVGSYSYDTQVGGNTTVPQLHVDSIKQIGHN